MLSAANGVISQRFSGKWKQILKWLIINH